MNKVLGKELTSSQVIGTIFTGFLGLMMLHALFLVFMIVPNERVMGPVQRIFYFHVGSAIACYVAFAIVLISSLAYLGTRSDKADVYQQASSEVAFLFATIVLATGMIWGKAAWNTWFRWEPRLVTFLLLWFIGLALVLTRSFSDSSRTALHTSVLGILGAITVPIVVFSIKLLPGMVQLHPQVIEKQGLKHPAYVTALIVSLGALVMLTICLTWYRARIGFAEKALEKEGP